MKEYIKNTYFIEETQNIEGSYIEVKIPFVNEDRTKALDIYRKLASKKTNNSGSILNEYKIKAEESYFYQLLGRWSKFPADFYRKIQVINY